jgi:hypothetical protein
MNRVQVVQYDILLFESVPASGHPTNISWLAPDFLVFRLNPKYGWTPTSIRTSAQAVDMFDG